MLFPIIEQGNGVDMAGSTPSPRKQRARNLSGEAALFASLVSIATSQDSAESAMQQCLSAVCVYIGWPVGHLYVDAADGTGELVPTDTWHLDDPDGHAEFRDITMRTQFAPGIGLPGRVSKLGEPVWIPDVQRDTNFPRNKVAADIGVRAAIGVPVKTAGQVSAVLEFFEVEAVEPDQRVLGVVKVLGNQIGQILQRQRANENLEKAREIAEKEIRSQLADEETRFLHLLETAPDAIVLVDDKGQITSVNAAFEQLLGYERGEVEGQRVEFLLPGRFSRHEDLRNNYARAPYPRQMGTASRVYIALHKDGHEIPAHISLSPLSTSEGTVITATIRDASAQVHAERERSVLAEVSQIVTSSLDLRDIFDDFAAKVSELVPADRVVISLLTDDPELVVDSAMWGVAVEGPVLDRPMPVSEVVRLAVQQHQAQSVSGQPVHERSGLHHSAAAPLIVAGKAVGTLNVDTTVETGYSQEHLRLLQVTADQIAGTIANQQLFQRTKRLAFEEEKLASIGRAITASHRLEDAYEHLAAEIHELLPYDRFVLGQHDANKSIATRRLIILDGKRVGGSETEWSFEDTLVSLFEPDQRSGLLLDGSRLEELSKTVGEVGERLSQGFRCCLTTPLVWEDEVIGAVNLWSRQDDAYGQIDVRLIERIADQMAGAISNGDLTQSFESQATRQKALAEIGRVVNSNLDVDAVYAAVADALGPLVSYDRFSISLLTPDGGTERAFVRGIEMEGEETGTAAFEVDRRPDGSLLFNSTSQSNPMDPFASVGLQSRAEVPLGAVDFPIGYLSVRSTAANAYTELDIDLMKQISGQISPAIENARLITELEVRAHTDFVSGLPNRPSFETSLDSRITSGEDSAAAVLAVKIDRMRELENQFGVEFADGLFRAIGERLVSEFSEEFVIGCIGQDEFGIGIFGRDAAMRWAEVTVDIVAACTRPFEIEGELIGLDVAMGVALRPGHARSGKDLTRKAILAVRSDGETNETTNLFTLELEESASDHVRILTAVRRGMENNEIALHYQPKIDLATGRIVGAEALARWDSLERGMISPAEFIPILEDSGYMWEFTGWTIAEAVEQIQQWSDSSVLLDEEPFQLAINVSARDFQDPRLPARIKANLELWGIEPGLLEIEVTETAMMQVPEAAIQVCRELKEMGLSVAIDDFGVGQSPLAYLDRLDVDIIKIDRAFVVNIDQSETSRSIVQAIIGLGTQLGKKVIAEGVETEEEFQVLRELGCHQGQGYFWARPMPEAEFRQLLQNGLRNTD